ncbi:uncharacterized protein K02A2.6-like [Ostrea edulis]|uniref:uncharacterized protein K02A2.6-like n=1 Tax=Ostrea edulis TaxID=37623 RepID=UPI0024AEA04B|nr:uncharacterized protein K02A2.6-like [Ostrea edulis]
MGTLSIQGRSTFRNELCAIGQIILRLTRIVIPKTLRARILELGHEGHPGIVVMKRNLRSKLWWPGMDRSVEKTCRSCHGCQLVSAPSKPEPMIRTQLLDAPWEQLAADFMGPLPSGDYLFVLVDYYSKYKVVEVMRSTTAEKTGQFLKKILSFFGLPLSITTDNGPQFASEVFATYMHENQIHHHRITPLWPLANGEVERQNRSLMKSIRIAQSEKKNWKDEFDNYLMRYRSSPHCVTGKSRSELMFGRKMRTKISQVYDFHMDDFEIRDQDAEIKEKGKDYGDKKRGCTQSNVIPGDKVLVKQHRENKLDPTFKPEPMIVKAKHGNSVILDSNGVEYKRNVTHVKTYIEQPLCQETTVPSPVVMPPMDSPPELHVDPPVKTIDSPELCETESIPVELPTSRP